MADYTFNPTGSSTAPKQANNNDTGKEKYRIYNVFKPTIVLDEMSLQETNAEGKAQKQDCLRRSL